MTQKLTLYNWLLLFVSTLFLPGCVGEDVKEDSIKSIEITASKTALLANQTSQVTAILQNPFDDKFEGEVAWTNTNSEVATIDASGTVTAKGEGQTKITAVKDGVTSNELIITVVNSLTAVAMVNVTAPANNVAVGNTLQLTATAQNINGENLIVANYTWSSNNPSIATVDASGVVTGVTNGSVMITATTNGVNSQNFELTIGTGSELNGEFSGLGNYNVSGRVTLKTTANNALEIVLASNFSSSAGPGLHVYLSNSTTGGLEVAPLRKTSGSDTYQVSGVALDQYKYVLVYCKPFSVTFGAAELK
ncbi:DM13 domain-containing protein [uncultured Microscilla sp.]|uniref:DM13 domain-containing protein n=1 Tax=uncultured Microscilla sp. TaxID=432653 RepID=UPI0026259365|nr:DM13 domain-containing protein [uncultured Microscilla sp.]